MVQQPKLMIHQKVKNNCRVIQQFHSKRLEVRTPQGPCTVMLTAAPPTAARVQKQPKRGRPTKASWRACAVHTQPSDGGKFGASLHWQTLTTWWKVSRVPRTDTPDCTPCELLRKVGAGAGEGGTGSGWVCLLGLSFRGWRVLQMELMGARHTNAFNSMKFENCKMAKFTLHVF